VLPNPEGDVPGIRVVLSTGYGFSVAAQQMIDEGMVGFVQSLTSCASSARSSPLRSSAEPSPRTATFSLVPPSRGELQGSPPAT